MSYIQGINAVNFLRIISILAVLIFGFALIIKPGDASANWPYETNPTAPFEAETMTRTGDITVVNDSSASASKTLRFRKNNTATKTFSLPKKVDYIEVNARGIYCNGSWPKITIKLGNVTIASNVNISSSTIKDFGFPRTINQGNQTLKISITNYTSSCNRYLYVDTVEFYSFPAYPTVSLTASPSTVNPGGSSTLSWNSNNSTSCTGSGAWSGSKALSGSQNTGTLSATTTYTLLCSGPGGSSSASTTINVNVLQNSPIYWGSWIDGDTYGGTSLGRGDAPWDETTWDMFENNAGKKVSLLHYGQPPMWEQNFASNPANQIVGRGAIPFMDMNSREVNLSSITSGTYDSSIIQWANDVKNWGKPFLFRWNWEMNGTWFSWGSQAQQNPALYVQSWRYIHNLVSSQGASNVTWVWCPNATFSGSTPISQLYPGDQYVDWTCIDGYNWGTSGGNGSGWKSFSDVFGPTYNEINTIAPTKPMLIGETASNEGGGSKASWITDALSTQIPSNFPNIKAVAWFNWPVYENGVTQQFPIESSASTQSAFMQAIGSSYYASNNYGNLPPLTKVQPIN